MKAILWGYQYKDMLATWSRQMTWVVNALLEHKVEVKKHKSFNCKGLENLPFYINATDNPSDICIYNHADVSHLTGDILKVKKNWFFKPTVPDEFHTTLDELGYGAYSSITYNKPNFENIENKDVNNFFETQVNNWIINCNNKWGNSYNFSKEEIPFENYILVLGQNFSDEVVTRYDFGHYFSKLHAVVKELHRISNEQIIVKLHPFTDGMDLNKTNITKRSTQLLQSIGKRVKIYGGRSNIHSFIEKAKCVVLGNSGSGFEVMMHHKPIISWGFPEYHWVTGNLHHLAHLRELLKLDWFNKELSDKFLYWYMEKYCFYNQETANRRIKELLGNIK